MCGSRGDWYTGGMEKVARRVLTLAAFAVSYLVYSPRANACSGLPRGWLGSRQVLPADASLNVPTNTRVVLAYVGSAPAVVDHPKLQTRDGVEVATTVSALANDVANSPNYITYVLSPNAPLVPNTEYQVLSAFGQIPCVQNDYFYSGMLAYKPCISVADAAAGNGGVDGGTPAPSVVVSSFTTGQGPDRTAPALSGDLTYSTIAQACDGSPCCGPYDGYAVTLSWNDASDDEQPILYELVQEGKTVLFPVPSSKPSVQGAFLCSGGFVMNNISMMSSIYPDMYPVFLGTNGLYQIVAVDLAGNRSNPIGGQVAIDCNAGLDGGIDGGADSQGVVDSPQDLASAIDVPSNPERLDGSEPHDVPLQADAATPSSKPDAGTLGPDADQPEKTDRGCSCHLADSKGTPAGVLVLTLGWLLAAHARRRKR
jgi:hypothetical protein